MAFRDLSPEMAEADRSLSSVVTVTLQEQLDQVYEQSCWGLGVISGGNLGASAAIAHYQAEEWEHFNGALPGLHRWPGFPVPLRPNREGTWRTITIYADVKATEAAKVRLYLLGHNRTNEAAIREDPDGFTGVTSFAEQDIPGDDTFHSYAFEITPDEASIPGGEGVALSPIAWLHGIAYASDFPCTTTIRFTGIEESL